jgi:hypothetical protein
MPRTVSRHKIAFEVAIYRSCKLTLTLPVLFVRCPRKLIYMDDFTVRLVEIAGIVHRRCRKRWLSKSTKMTLVGTMSFVGKPFGRQTFGQQIIKNSANYGVRNQVSLAMFCMPTPTRPRVIQGSYIDESPWDL